MPPGPDCRKSPADFPNLATIQGLTVFIPKGDRADPAESLDPLKRMKHLAT